MKGCHAGPSASDVDISAPGDEHVNYGAGLFHIPYPIGSCFGGIVEKGHVCHDIAVVRVRSSL